jgi:hypothetical protein
MICRRRRVRNLLPADYPTKKWQVGTARVGAILVVEDQLDNRKIIRDMLAGIHYEITEERTAKRHSQRLRSNGLGYSTADLARCAMDEAAKGILLRAGRVAQLRNHIRSSCV